MSVGSPATTGTFTVNNATVDTPPKVTNVLLTSLAGQITATDNEGDTISYAVTTPAAYGTGTVNSSGAITYTAGVGFTGTDSFVVTLTDGYGGSTNCTINVSNQTTSVDGSGSIGALAFLFFFS